MLVVAVVALVLLLGGALLLGQQKTATAPTNEMQTEATPISSDSAVGEVMNASPSSDTTMEQGEVQEFAVSGEPFKFTPDAMTVKKGTTVKVTFTNKEGMHNWVLDEFNAKTNTIAAGKSETVTFVADKVGSFEYYCSVGNHRAMGMVGTLTVTE